MVSPPNPPFPCVVGCHEVKNRGGVLTFLLTSLLTSGQRVRLPEFDFRFSSLHYLAVLVAIAILSGIPDILKGAK